MPPFSLGAFAREDLLSQLQGGKDAGSARIFARASRPDQLHEAQFLLLSNEITNNVLIAASFDGYAPLRKPPYHQRPDENETLKEDDLLLELNATGPEHSTNTKELQSQFAVRSPPLPQQIVAAAAVLGHGVAHLRYEMTWEHIEKEYDGSKNSEHLRWKRQGLTTTTTTGTAAVMTPMLLSQSFPYLLEAPSGGTATAIALTPTSSTTETLSGPSGTSTIVRVSTQTVTESINSQQSANGNSAESSTNLTSSSVTTSAALATTPEPDKNVLGGGAIAGVVIAGVARSADRTSDGRNEKDSVSFGQKPELEAKNAMVHTDIEADISHAMYEMPNTAAPAELPTHPETPVEADSRESRELPSSEQRAQISRSRTPLRDVVYLSTPQPNSE
ncbi:MAG: hypothetical protein M1820_010064 [Bogoriella megaspora]|nr:MAG: hypothetical protein M1820_010064 [Bogoriella megaspora]